MKFSIEHSILILVFGKGDTFFYFFYSILNLRTVPINFKWMVLWQQSVNDNPRDDISVQDIKYSDTKSLSLNEVKTHMDSI
jgi:hypothetical protein